ARLVWRRFRRHRLGLLGITVIGLIALALLYAEPSTYKKWLQGHVDDWVRSW
ncbi:MAG: hypothetical protein EBV45_10565, partial [Chloroflexi bacterium]|nr:hypothetical protein [Chloroflexota bacterium]